jgi:hypothetical protein
MGIVEVTTVVESAGQLVTVGAQLVIVISLVVYTVEVVHLGGALEPGAEEVTGELPLGPAGLEEDPAGAVWVGTDPPGAVSVGEDPAGVVDWPAAGVVSVTGQTVVEMAMVEVTTVVESAGQLVTVGAQLVIVISLVVYTVEVVHLGGELDTGAAEVTGELPLGPAGLDDDPAGTLSVGIEPVGAVSVGEDPTGVVDWPAAGVVSVTGHTVVEMAMVEVTTVVESAGQLVTVGAQLVIVISLVVYTVEVVHLGGALEPGVIPAAGEVAAGTE